MRDSGKRGAITFAVAAPGRHGAFQGSNTKCAVQCALALHLFGGGESFTGTGFAKASTPYDQRL